MGDRVAGWQECINPAVYLGQANAIAVPLNTERVAREHLSDRVPRS